MNQTQFKSTDIFFHSRQKMETTQCPTRSERKTNKPWPIHTTQHHSSLVAQKVKNPPAMQDTQGQPLGWEDLPEKGMTAHASILTGESHGQRSLAGHRPQGFRESDTELLTLSLSL